MTRLVLSVLHAIFLSIGPSLQKKALMMKMSTKVFLI